MHQHHHVAPWGLAGMDGSRLHHVSRGCPHHLQQGRRYLSEPFLKGLTVCDAQSHAQSPSCNQAHYHLRRRHHGRSKPVLWLLQHSLGSKSSSRPDLISQEASSVVQPPREAPAASPHLEQLAPLGTILQGEQVTRTPHLLSLCPSSNRWGCPTCCIPQQIPCHFPSWAL